MSGELNIFLYDEDKYYYPGDVIQGFIQINPNKSADIQHISLNFKGTVDAHGERIVLIDKTQVLATPVDGKYRVFNSGKSYKFEFQFDIPINKSLPSYSKLHKVAHVSYLITATPKKPSFNFSHTLPVIKKEVKLLDRISVDSVDYCRNINMNTDLGFTNGSKSTQWNITASRSAFIRGENIELECNLNNFPPMKKSKAIKISFIRYVHKTNSAKIIDKKILSHKTIDLHVIDIASTQSIKSVFNIPGDTPVSVFPATGRIMSISYIILAELNMKGVKSAIKLKDLYTQEAAIVIGTHTQNQGSPYGIDLMLNRRESILGHAFSSQATISTASLNHRASTPNNFRTISAACLPMQQLPVKSFHGALTDDSEIKPLARLDENKAVSYSSDTSRRSYLSRNNSPTSSILPSASYFDPRTVPRSPPNLAMRHHSQVTTPIDRSITPMPPVSPNTGYNTISYINRTDRSPIILEPILPSSGNIMILPPNEIGPDDIINRGDYKGKIHSNDNEKTIFNNYDGDKLERSQSPLSRIPSLTRHDTVSTSSSVGLMNMFDDQNQHYYNTASVPSSIPH